MASNPRYIAGGTIEPCRFVKADATGPFKVIQAAAITDKIVGISQPGSHDAPGLSGSGTDAAVSGESINVLGLGEEGLLELGGTVDEGDYLRSDANGKGVALAFTFSGTATAFYGARALEAGISGDFRRVQCQIGPAPGISA